MEREVSKVIAYKRGSGGCRVPPILLAIFVSINLLCLTASGSTSSEFGLSPRELGRLQTPHPHGSQLFSSPVAASNHDQTNVELFVTHRLSHGASKEPITYFGATLFIPFVPRSTNAWLTGLGFGLGNPTFGLFKAEGSTTTTPQSQQSKESLDLRTTLNSRPLPGLDIAFGLRSLARLLGSIDVKVADAGNETFVINRLVTAFRPEVEARWQQDNWAILSGYRHRLIVDYDVPLNAALEDPVPLDLPTLSIRGIAFIEPASIWLSGFYHQSARTWGWRMQVELAEPRGIGLTGLTPTEERVLPPVERRWNVALSNSPRSLTRDELQLNYSGGIALREGAPLREQVLRTGLTAEISKLDTHYSLGCVAQLKLAFQFETLICSLGVHTAWETIP